MIHLPARRDNQKKRKKSKTYNIRLSQTVRKLWPVQSFVYSGDKYISKKELSLLFATLTLVFSSVATKYFQIFQTIKKLWSAKAFGIELFQGRYKKKRTK